MSETKAGLAVRDQQIIIRTSNFFSLALNSVSQCFTTFQMKKSTPYISFLFCHADHNPQQTICLSIISIWCLFFMGRLVQFWLDYIGVFIIGNGAVLSYHKCIHYMERSYGSLQVIKACVLNFYLTSDIIWFELSMYMVSTLKKDWPSYM